MKRSLLLAVLWSLVLWLLMLVAAANIAHAATRQPKLEARAPGTPGIYCADSELEWEKLTRGKGSDTAGYTWRVPPPGITAYTIWLAPTTCDELRHPLWNSFSDGAATLYHEYAHSVYRIVNEGEAECKSLSIYRRMLRVYWRFGPARVKRYYDLAWRAHVVLSILYPIYRGTCHK